jgi:catechol 2,3-dioxygenase-like lactoylglutathione lyase family enzyme
MPEMVQRARGEIYPKARGVEPDKEVGQMPHLFRVIVPVGDIERATLFYGGLLGAVGLRVSPGRHYFECEGTILACYDPRADGDGRGALPLPEPIYIAVDDLESTYASAETAGASFSSVVGPEVGALGRIARRPWGERSFYAADPFGNPLCFVSRDSVFTGRTEDRP